MGSQWARYVAIAFAVLTMGAGAGFLVGGVTFLFTGRSGNLFNSPFSHISEVMGWGAGCLVSSLTTFRLLGFWGRRAVEIDAGKPIVPGTRGLD